MRESGFNPVLGFLTASTTVSDQGIIQAVEFQSRAGFSDRFDTATIDFEKGIATFQSRAGFSDRFDPAKYDDGRCIYQFQSRAGFSDRFDVSYGFND